MERKQIQQILNGVVIFIFGLFDLVLLVRLMLRFIGASTDSSFVSFWYDLSHSLYRPFEGTIADIGSGSLVFELDTLFAMGFYFLLALLGIGFIKGAFKEKFLEKVQSLVNLGFKVLEAILALRLFFKLIGASLSQFIEIVYEISAPVYEPFQGLLPTLETGSIVFETSTLIAIIILIIFDYAFDKLFEELTKDSPGRDKSQHQPFATTQQPAPQPAPQPQPIQQPTPPPPAPAPQQPMQPAA